MKALLLVDLQNDFMPEGALAIHNAHQIIPIINQLLSHFPLVVASQDWHPSNHVSFFSSHPGKQPHDVIKIQKKEQILWPPHCVQNSKGAALVDELDQTKIARSFFKGTDPHIDSYSAFFDNNHEKSTELATFLKSHQVTDLFLVGLATDYCILYSALDALELGFAVTVITDAVLPVSLHPQDEKSALNAIVARGGRLKTSQEVLS